MEHEPRWRRTVLCAALFSVIGCVEPPHIVVRVQAGASLVQDAVELRIATTNEADPPETVFDALFDIGTGEGAIDSLDGEGARFTLLPADDYPRFHLRLELIDADGAVLSTVSADGVFPEDGGRELNLTLEDVCRNIQCDPGATCVAVGAMPECVTSCFGLLPIGTERNSESVDCACEGRPDGSLCESDGPGRCWSGACCTGCWSGESCVSAEDTNVESCGFGGRECSACECGGDACDPARGCLPQEEARALGVGDEHACAGTATGVFCWGDNANRELGVETPSDIQYDPVRSFESVSVGQVEASDSATCVLSHGGGFTCWGLDTSGELPFIDGDSPSPVTPEALRDFQGLAMGTQHGCTTKVSETGGDARLHCWGANWDHQLGVLETNILSEPTDVQGDLEGGVEAFAADRRNTCLILDGGLYCTGQNSEGQTGLPVGDRSNVQEFARVFENTGIRWTDVSIYIYGCGLDERGAHYCWGTTAPQLKGLCTDNCAALADEAYSFSGPPADRIETAFHHCLLSRSMTEGYDGGLYCYGPSDRSGVHGTSTGSPDRVGLLGWRWSDVRVGLESSCGIREDQTVWCWGRYESRQVGVPPMTSEATRPVRRCFE